MKIESKEEPEDAALVPATQKLENMAMYETMSLEQRKVFDRLGSIVTEVEGAIAKWLQDKGLTATSAKHIWLHEDLETFEVREGVAPLDKDRPEYLKGQPLTICQFRLPGVVIRFREVAEERFARLRRNPRAGEMEAFVKSLGNG